MRKKRGLCLLLAAALLAGLLAMPASGAVGLAFVAVNDAIPLTLSGGELPFYAGGALYVPYTVFSASSLGFYPSYNVSDRLLTLFSRNQRLVFDLSAGSVSDESKIVYEMSAISRSGVLFLPAAFCANHFGVQVSALTSRDGYPVIRFTTGAQVYDDELFLEKAENLIAYRVEQTQAPAEPTPTPPAPSAPAAPPAAEPTPPPVEPDPTPPDEPEVEPAQVYLAVTGVEGAETALEALAAEGVQAVFYLTADEIAAQGDLVRRIAADGHLLGVTAAAGEGAEGLRRANDALDRALRRKTLLAMLPAADAAADGQYCLLLRPEVLLTPQDAAQAHGQRCVLFTDCAQLPAALAVLRAEAAEIPLLTETTAAP